MKWTCKKCGKTLDISREQLAETQGVVVCPQCLASDVVAGYSSRAGAKRSVQSVPSPPASESKNSSSATPPPYRKKINFVETPVNRSARPAAGSSTTSLAPKKKKKSKKKKRRGALAPHSPAGCIWRSVVYTLIFLLAVTVVGFILDLV